MEKDFDGDGYDGITFLKSSFYVGWKWLYEICHGIDWTVKKTLF